MDWETLLNKGRLGKPDVENKSEAGRSHFHKDHDRVVFSASFRRLGKKTQVHPLAENDHIHTRLTHSIEVASVGRSLGIKVGSGLNGLPNGITPANIGEIVQSACLAHDIGNPPFGHAGEEAIRSWFDKNQSTNKLFDDLSHEERLDFTTFDGNALGFRVITKTETMSDGGLGLTYPTLGAFLKYPWSSTHGLAKKNKFSCFNSELETLTLITEKLGLCKFENNIWCRHPFAYLVEAADDVCYAILDLEDAVEMKILPIERIMEVMEPIIKSDVELIKCISDCSIPKRKKIAHVRGRCIGKFVKEASSVFTNNIGDILEGKFQGSLLDFSDSDIKNVIVTAKELAKNEIFDHKRKIEIEIGSYQVLGTLLDAFCHAMFDKVKNNKLSFKSERILKLLDSDVVKNKDMSLYEGYMCVLDYIGGMTDNFATYMANQIGGIKQH